MEETKKKFSKFDYNNEYAAEHYDRITILLPKGRKDKIKKYCQNKKISMSEFINACLDEKLKRLKIDL